MPASTWLIKKYRIIAASKSRSHAGEIEFIAASIAVVPASCARNGKPVGSWPWHYGHYRLTHRDSEEIASPHAPMDAFPHLVTWSGIRGSIHDQCCFHDFRQFD